MNARRLASTTSTVKWKVKRAKPYGGKRQALTQDELDRLFAALRGNRHGHRDYMVALVTLLHGLRVSELIDLRWDDIDWRKGTIAIRRLKGSIDGTHYLERDEAVGLKRLQREQEPRRPHIFTSERGQAFSGFAINKMIATAGRKARITWSVHPHCLRAHHRHDAGQWRHGRLAIEQADGPCLDRQHHQIRPDEPRAVEDLAGQTLCRHLPCGARWYSQTVIRRIGGAPQAGERGRSPEGRAGPILDSRSATREPHDREHSADRGRRPALDRHQQGRTRTGAPRAVFPMPIQPKPRRPVRHGLPQLVSRR